VLQHPAFPVALNASHARASASKISSPGRDREAQSFQRRQFHSSSGSAIPRHSRGGAPTEFASDTTGATNRGWHEIFLKRCCESCRTPTAAVQQNDLALGGVGIVNAPVQGHQRKMADRSIKLDAFRVCAHQDEYHLAGMFFLVVGATPPAQMHSGSDRLGFVEALAFGSVTKTSFQDPM